jgi:pimeloyl-ACP methyl ester carboxylesterase
LATTIINGLAVEISGEGTPVLCIHGLGGSSNTWTPIMDALARFKVLRVDLPGSARSPLAGAKLSIAAYVEAVEQLIAGLDLGPLHVVAHSMGTIVAQHLAVRNPQLVRSLALFGPLVAPPDAARANIAARAQLARNGTESMQEIADAVVKGATSAETKQQKPVVLALVRECIMRQTAEGYAQSCEALAQAQAADIGRIACPTLLVTGDQDGVAPQAAVGTMAEKIAGSRMQVLSGCGHWTTFEKPEECIAQLNAFYK